MLPPYTGTDLEDIFQQFYLFLAFRPNLLQSSPQHPSLHQEEVSSKLASSNMAFCPFITHHTPHSNSTGSFSSLCLSLTQYTYAPLSVRKASPLLILSWPLLILHLHLWEPLTYPSGCQCSFTSALPLSAHLLLKQLLGIVSKFKTLVVTGALKTCVFTEHAWHRKLEQWLN
jgi:hypothetical protein